MCYPFNNEAIRNLILNIKKSTTTTTTTNVVSKMKHLLITLSFYTSDTFQNVIIYFKFKWP